MFPDMQDRPVVVNLWGLTGVGKTSLVLKMAEELKLMEDLYHIDLGESYNNHHSLGATLHDMLKHGNGRPNLILLDEFQHARTLDEQGKENRAPEIRAVWQLLDSGKFLARPDAWEFRELSNELPKLRQMVNSGIRVERGLVVEGQRFFAEKMNLYQGITDSEDQRPPIPLIQDMLRDHLFELIRPRFENPFLLADHLLSLDGPESIRFLESILFEAQQPKIVDCTKSLIVVLGNLDEAYPMTSDLNPDMEADVFHEMSLKISVTQIKAALQQRFRNEQISRLGNTHIIYPAFDRMTFEAIIIKELAQISDWMWQTQRLRVTFDESIHEILFKEGVFPTQGARPVLSTIHNIIRSKMAAIAVEAKIKGFVKNQIHLRFEHQSIRVEFLDNVGRPLHSMNFVQPLSLESLRVSKNDDMQAIVAVHEAGHAVAILALRRLMPEMVMSNTANPFSAGFVHVKEKATYVSKSHILNRLACDLAGYAAEKLIFGDENVTMGSSQDIEHATTSINHVLKACGMGNNVASYHVKSEDTRWFLYDEDDRLSNEAETWLKDALELAERTLTHEMKLLVAVADHLSDHRLLEKGQLRELVSEFAVGIQLGSLIEDGSHLYYRNRLKEFAKGSKKKHLLSSVAPC